MGMKRFWRGLSRVSSVGLGAAFVAVGMWTLVFEIGTKVNPWEAVISCVLSVVAIAGGVVLIISFCWAAGQGGES